MTREATLCLNILSALLKFSDCQKGFLNKFGQVMEKSFDFVLSLFGFMKATKFRDSSEFSACIQNVLSKSCVPCQCYM